MKQILIVDDDIYIGNMLEEVLTKEGYLVLRAYSGTEALLVLTSAAPDLVLLDLMLPGLSGEEVLPRIREFPVIVLSAKADLDSKVNLLLEGASDYVTKPFEMKELIARINAVLRRTEIPNDTSKRLVFDKLVVDLRMSPGGNAKFVSCFQEDYAKGLTAGQVYVLTGGYTGSASLSYIAVLKDTLGAVTVGEPTGQFTSFFHMQSSLDKPVVLPNSQISVMLSNSWRDGDPLVEVQYDENGKLYPWESMILPDVYVYQDIEDIRQGLDSVIEWVLAQ